MVLYLLWAIFIMILTFSPCHVVLLLVVRQYAVVITGLAGNTLMAVRSSGIIREPSIVGYEVAFVQ
jgi:hypothetical protein